MQLIDVRPQHQSHVRNFSKIANPGTSRGRKLTRFEPIIGEINPGRFFADDFLVTLNILRNDIVLGRIVCVGSYPAEIKSVIELSRRRRCDGTGESCDCCKRYPERSEAKSRDPAAPRNTTAQSLAIAKHDRTVAAVYDRRNSYQTAVIRLRPLRRDEQTAATDWQDDDR